MSEQKTLLLVDDSVENLKYLHTLLTSANFTVMPAPSGKLALRAIEHKQPDLVLLDINMPEMSGHEVCQAIRRRDGMEDIPVIFISGSAEENELESVLSCGGNALLTKPFSMQELLTVINDYLP